MRWPDTRVLDLFGVDVPIVQAPMAGSNGSELAAAVSGAGGLGSLPCAMLSIDAMRTEVAAIRAHTSRPFNLNFFAHHEAPPDSECEAAWERRAQKFYAELGISAQARAAAPSRAPFDHRACTLVEELRPAVVSFHFGLPDAALVARVRATGAKIIASATTVEEARALEAGGCDAVVAQGFEAGGHRASFLAKGVDAQVGTMALVPQMVDAVKVPVIASGGITDARGIVAAFALGASAVQLGTAYLLCPEAKTSAVHRAALAHARDDSTVLTNAFSGGPARGLVNRWMREVGALTHEAPAFPRASGALAPLRAAAEAKGSGDFSPLWAGQAAHLARSMPAAELTRALAEAALSKLSTE